MDWKVQYSNLQGTAREEEESEREGEEEEEEEEERGEQSPNYEEIVAQLVLTRRNETGPSLMAKTWPGSSEPSSQSVKRPSKTVMGT